MTEKTAPSRSDRITDEKIARYLEITKKAFGSLEIRKGLDSGWDRKARDILDMAKRYYADANFYMQKGDYVTAFAAVNYAHGYLDTGARLGLFEVDNSEELFAVDQ